MSMNDDDLFQMFLEETTEHLEVIERDLVVLEETGGTDEIINRIFRAIHSIKGSAGFLGWSKLKSLAHAMENILNLMRNKSLEPYPEVVTCLLGSSDLLRNLVECQEKGHEEEIASRIAELESLAEQPPQGESGSQAKGASQPAATEKTKPEKPSETVEGITESPAPAVPAATQSPEIPVSEIQVISQEKPASEPAPVPDPSPAPTQPETDSSHEEEDQESGPGDTRIQLPVSPSVHIHQVAETLRVNVKVLDTLMTLAGELVLTRNQLLQQVTNWNPEGITAAAQRLNMVTSELQEAVMSTRMQPVGNVFNKFLRVVRDLSRQLDKEVNLSIEGNAVELDKAIIEAIGDPLTHLVRNAVDHGIETRSERGESGKPAIATICLKAFHEAGHVIIEVWDDGRGIDIEKIKAKAVSQGLTDRFSLESQGRSEILGFIFHPGFSLASQVTDLSGRGVGMDVVQSNISKLGGSVEIDTEMGRGTKFRIKLPLTLTIIPSLVVEAQGEYFAIPQANIMELVRIPATQVQNRLERLGGAVVVRVRDRLLPLIRLTDVLGIDERKIMDPVSGSELLDRRQHLDDRRQKNDRFEFQGEIDIEGFSRWLGTVSRNARAAAEKGNERRSSSASALNIVVVNAGELNYGIVVDNLVDSEEIVVKPLGRNLQDCGIYAGATIRGDGNVALILDVSGIRRAARLEMKDLRVDKNATGGLRDRAVDAQTLLVGRHGRTWISFPLGLISRIERIDRSSIERTGGKLGIQYRGGTLPLISMDQVSGLEPLEERNAYFVVVFPFSGREVGILSTEIEDIVDSVAKIDDLTHKQPGVLGSCILNNRTTLLIDPFEAIRRSLPDWSKEQEELSGTDSRRDQNSTRPSSKAIEATSADNATPENQQEEPPVILVVEDSSFFQKQIGSFISDAGFRVAMASDGREGFELARAMADQLSLVLTDIEMPHMDGIAMTRAIRAETSIAHIPVIAVTSLAGEAAEKRGREAGINQYLIKLDREKIIGAIRDQLTQRGIRTDFVKKGNGALINAQ